MIDIDIPEHPLGVLRTDLYGVSTIKRPDFGEFLKIGNFFFRS
jgi:hypothetical protein